MKSLPNQRLRWNTATLAVALALMFLSATAFAQNSPPIVDAGPDQSIFVGEYAVLQGSATDPDGNPIASYLWTVETAPIGSSPVFSDDGNPNSTFTTDLAGDYVLSLVASDGALTSAPDFVTIVVAEILPPVADAQADVVSGPAPLTVGFDGSASYDPQGGDLTFDWSFGDGNSSAEMSPTHTYVSPGVYSVALRVFDSLGQIAVDTLELTVTSPANNPPVALADGPIWGVEGMPCTMDASASYDPDEDPLTYNWDLGDGSTVETTEPTIAYTYPNAGTYNVTLVVNDGELDSDPFLTVANIASTGGGGRVDVDAFLILWSPFERRTDLPAGTTSFAVDITYGSTIDPATFKATLNKQPFTSFTPAPGARQTVNIPLVPGHNTLRLQVDGVRDDGKTATDRDMLTLIVP